jgi:hypothetical protein
VQLGGGIGIGPIKRVFAEAKASRGRAPDAQTLMLAVPDTGDIGNPALLRVYHARPAPITVRDTGV